MVGIADIILESRKDSSAWTKKQRRAYGRCMAGCKRGLFVHGLVYHLTLTSARVHDRLAHAWDLLVKRVRRELNFEFNYFKVETKEGNGVFHVIFHGEGWQSWTYDEIHAYFSCLWRELNNSPVVWVTPYSSAKKIAGYLIGQYVCGQTFSRMSYSVFWCFKGFVKKFYSFIKLYGFKKGIHLFDFLIQSSIKNFTPSQSLLLFSI